MSEPREGRSEDLDETLEETFPASDAPANTVETGIRVAVDRRSRMPQTENHARHKRPHSQSMAGTYLEFNLDGEISQLHDETAWSTGQNAKTLVKYDDFRVVLMVLRAHARLPGHHTEGRLSIQTVRGRIQVRAEGRTFDLPAGALLALDRGVVHDVEAREDSAVLLTIAWPGPSAR